VNASSYKGKISREELCRCALYLLQNLPSAHHAVLEYLCDLFDEAVNAHILEIELGSNVTGTMGRYLHYRPLNYTFFTTYNQW
jgi:hypothetical protein